MYYFFFNWSSCSITHTCVGYLNLVTASTFPFALCSRRIPLRTHKKNKERTVFQEENKDEKKQSKWFL